MVSIGLWFFRQGLDAATQAIEETNEARALLAERASELDVAYQLLAERTQKLESANAELESQNWYNTGRSLLYEAIREAQDISMLADKVLMQLCKLLDFPVGTLFILEDETLTRVGKYAFPSNTTLADRFKLGEGLVGQAALEKRVILVQDMPPDSLTISSGLGQVPPAGLLIVPLIYDEQVIGVMEFGLLKVEVETEKDFLTSVSESIAIAFNTAQNRSQIDQLLAETQRQAKELQDQEEELRAANKELQEQAKIL
jgi:transcriptional regulator with GAF, ATPase, and Fis domain